jgi:hypothetical protein
VVVFRHMDHLDFDRTVGRDLTATRGHAFLEGGDVLPEIVLDNSHDGTGAYRLMAGLFRLACLNGLIVAEGNVTSVSVRHVGAATAGKVIDGAFQVLEETPKAVAAIGEWRGIALPEPARVAFAEAARDLRWGRDDANNTLAPVEAAQLLRANRLTDNGNDLWTTFNRVQENVIRGGVAGRGSTNRRLTTRAVNSPAANVKLNRDLWALAANVAALVKGGDAAKLAA